MIGYTYRELCFDLDNYFGFPEKSQLGKMIKESGAKVDFETVTVDKDGNADYSKLYNMNAVSAFLDQYYAKVTPLRAKASVTPALVKAPSPIGTVLLIAIPSALFLTALAIVIIVIKKHSKKNTPEVSSF